METLLGWTLMGKLDAKDETDNCMTVLSMHVNNSTISDLWSLDTLGILDPVEKQSKIELENQTKELFLNSVQQDDTGRYIVSLPWLEEHNVLPSNKCLSEKRLKSSVDKMKTIGVLKDYECVFNEWKAEGIIEEIDVSKLEDSKCHYLPHRPVLKNNSTTKIRPVFDGSAKLKGCLSLNDCLAKGPNLIELIPSILNRFRLRKYGVISDIRKAFLQICLSEHDKDFVRFLWWENGDSGLLKLYRHCRVVFGIKSSPFLLGATLDYHLDRMSDHFQATAKHLKKSMYVDNCVTSVSTAAELKKFIEESKEIMALGKFDLRGWQHNLIDISKEDIDISKKGSPNVKCIPVLGLIWDIVKDTLKIDVKDTLEIEYVNVTKRYILSRCHKIFDPIGFTSPITLVPKMLLQECWKVKANWDETLPEDIVLRFSKWAKQLNKLADIEIPRWVLSEESLHNSLHVFCDASQQAYATCIFLRIENKYSVNCHLVAARARVAPLKSISISRLELLACCIGVRLTKAIKTDLEVLNPLPVFYWSDSMNCLYWIKNDEPWAVFVMNRVREIRSESNADQWNHVPGNQNPADLPSRGCSVDTLIAKEWWMGPLWLKEDQEKWPKSSLFPDKNVIDAEKKKTVTTILNVSNHIVRFLDRFSSFEKLIRVTAWMIRFYRNCQIKTICRLKGNLTSDEIKEAEMKIVYIIQQTSFVNSINDPRLKNLQTFVDSKGLLRIKTRMIFREDTKDFKYPIILPSDHPVVINLIRQRHEEMLHCGIQTLIANLRENYWILKIKKTVRKVVRQCVCCKRFNARHAEVNFAPLPEERIRDAACFEVTGIDLAGPLFLKDGSKSWIVLFTCAVFRAIHLELVSSLSTDKFLLALRRFIARRGRPEVIYTDNGKNFVGANRLLEKIDWDLIMTESSVKRITWKFIPPSPWWGGWWERLVALVKDLLKRILGKASLKYEEINSLLCECESVVNSRPITYLYEDDDLQPLTPSMFLRDLKECGVPDLDHLDSVSLQKRHIYRTSLREHLHKRFRLEYLGYLRENTKKIRKTQPISVGDIVLIENQKKRLHWPLGKVIQVFPSKDGIIRLAKVRYMNGEVLRPVQRLYSLEVNAVCGQVFRELETKSSSKIDAEKPNKVIHSTNKNQELSSTDPELPLFNKKTRLGREIKPVKRLDL